MKLTRKEESISLLVTNTIAGVKSPRSHLPVVIYMIHVSRNNTPCDFSPNKFKALSSTMRLN